MRRLQKVVRVAGFEPAAARLRGESYIHMSFTRVLAPPWRSRHDGAGN